MADWRLAEGTRALLEYRMASPQSTGIRVCTSDINKAATAVVSLLEEVMGGPFNTQQPG